ncbi:hypothetical protein GCM10012275_54340 [Longimycelium tulufanense]|uniref:Protein-L-isoaspartate O-methyltransferase n=1 Tax=Longimycelium tulufanense TaxID=907463 RepID=A0A8J3CD80_9PSEU|nr:methyltransferase, FxLD system [Longimycelium tulufanense]GGM76784.1 hypothetical protein GCM10012275_54340 [Longimycelium tulufanense]
MTTVRNVTMSTTDETARPAELREAMVGQLREMGAITSERVEAAFRAVPRHLFAPGAPLEEAYGVNSTVLTKRNEHGVAVSTVSAPRIQALMLEQAGLAPGMRVLEIGSGGVNAALISELVGPAGQVVTVDIDQEVVDRARVCLADAGYPDVRVVLADAEHGVPAHAPYDRIIVTVGAFDIPPAWREQLAPGGLIVVPLRLRAGMTRSVVLAPEGERLASRGYDLCSFVPMQGVGAGDERLVRLDGEDVGLRVDGDVLVRVEALRHSLSQPRVEAWSGVTLGGNERFDGLHLWLALNLPRFGVLQARPKARERGLVAHAWPLGMPTALDEAGESFAYLGLRPLTPDKQRCEFGAYGHGPHADDLVHQVIEHITSWDGTSLNAQIEVWPAGTPDDQFPSRDRALVVNRQHSRVVVSWP